MHQTEVGLWKKMLQELATNLVYPENCSWILLCMVSMTHPTRGVTIESEWQCVSLPIICLRTSGNG